MTANLFVSADLQAQREFAAQYEKEKGDFSLMVAGAFARGMRSIGYKNTGTAIDELIDNSIQGEASNVHVVFGFGRDPNKPSAIAVVDDGHGIPATMARLAVMWGGTHREDSRSGFGRFGFGLPSASVSQGRRFTVYSQVEGEPLLGITVDLDDIGEGKYTDASGRVQVPQPKAAVLPDFVRAYIKNTIKQQFTHGTVVVIEKLDNLTWKTTSHLQRNLLEHFGVMYRNYLRQVKLWVQGEPVYAVDPLFITPGFRHYVIENDPDRAEPLPPLEFEVKNPDTDESLGIVKVRFAYMPPTFLRMPEAKLNPRAKRNNARLKIRSDNNGLIVLRNGRQIDVLTRGGGWLLVNNDDRYCGMEVDFPAALDEELSITTSKQQVTLSDRLWNILKEQGVLKALRDMRGRYDREKKLIETTQDNGETPDAKRASELAMEDAERFKTEKPSGDPVKRAKKAEENLNQEAQRRAQEAGLPFEPVKRELEVETKGHPYKVHLIEAPGGWFFEVKQLGGQKALFLNTAHRFFTDVHGAPDVTPRLRAALETLLFVIGDCELDASDDRQDFYQAERMLWSTRLNTALSRLGQISSVEDAGSVLQKGDDYIAEMSQAA